MQVEVRAEQQIETKAEAQAPEALTKPPANLAPAAPAASAARLLRGRCSPAATVSPARHRLAQSLLRGMRSARPTDRPSPAPSRARDPSLCWQ